MDDPLEYLAGYVSPLTDKEHATIGRIALLWGQIEHYAEEVLPEISGLTDDQLDALQVTDKPMASKVAFLKASAHRYKHAQIRDDTLAFCTLIEETKTQRNHVFHGMWGWRGDERTKRTFPAARKSTDLNAPFPAAKLSALEKKLCKCSRLGFDLVARVVLGQLERPHPCRFFHHNVEPGAPEWLLQWTKRNPWVGGAPEYIEQAGQLPRRSRLYPER